MRIRIFAALVASSALTVTLAGPTAAAPECAPGPAPYANLAGAALVPEVHTSNDPDPVRYILWRGTVPTFDGMPLSVDVTVPCGEVFGLPVSISFFGRPWSEGKLIGIAHAFEQATKARKPPLFLPTMELA